MNILRKARKHQRFIQFNNTCLIPSIASSPPPLPSSSLKDNVTKCTKLNKPEVNNDEETKVKKKKKKRKENKLNNDCVLGMQSVYNGCLDEDQDQDQVDKQVEIQLHPPTPLTLPPPIIPYLSLNDRGYCKTQPVHVIPYTPPPPLPPPTLNYNNNSNSSSWDENEEYEEGEDEDSNNMIELIEIIPIEMDPPPLPPPHDHDSNSQQVVQTQHCPPPPPLILPNIHPNHNHTHHQSSFTSTSSSSSSLKHHQSSSKISVTVTTLAKQLQEREEAAIKKQAEDWLTFNYELSQPALHRLIASSQQSPPAPVLKIELRQAYLNHCQRFRLPEAPLHSFNRIVRSVFGHRLKLRRLWTLKGPKAYQYYYEGIKLKSHK